MQIKENVTEEADESFSSEAIPAVVRIVTICRRAPRRVLCFRSPVPATVLATPRDGPKPRLRLSWNGHSGVSDTRRVAGLFDDLN